VREGRTEERRCPYGRRDIDIGQDGFLLNRWCAIKSKAYHLRRIRGIRGNGPRSKEEEQEEKEEDEDEEQEE
jgi:hypothetical protein